MSDNIKNILEIYKSILENKKSLSEAVLNAPVPIKAVNSPFGEKRSYENHPGVDLKAQSGTRILSPANGKVIDVKQDSKGCGGTIFIDHQNGFKTRYCHVKDIKVNVGDQVTQGEFIGLSGGASSDKGKGNSRGAHLHFEVYKDGKLVDPMKYIDSDYTETSAGLEDDEKLDTKDIGNKILDTFIDSLSSMIGLKESKIYGSFGRDIKNIGGSYLLTKDKNDTIYSPVSGKIDNIKIRLGCKNQITIFHDFDNETYHLEFCGISKPYVKDGESVSKGEVLGKTNDDVTVTLYDNNWRIVNLNSASKKESSNKKDSSNSDNKNKKISYDDKKPISSYKSKTGYQDPTVDLLGSVLTYPFRYKEKEIEDKSKVSKFASPTSKNQPDPGFLLNMFKKKKVDENIERIKKLLK